MILGHESSTKMKKNIGLIFTITFSLFAILQYNDPDPWVWIIIYGIVAVLCLLQWLDKLYYKTLLVAAIAFAAATLSYAPEIYGWVMDGFPSITTEMHAESMYIELVRESLGLALSSIALFYLFIVTKQAQSAI